MSSFQLMFFFVDKIDLQLVAQRIVGAFELANDRDGHHKIEGHPWESPSLISAFMRSTTSSGVCARRFIGTDIAPIKQIIKKTRFIFIQSHKSGLYCDAAIIGKKRDFSFLFEKKTIIRARFLSYSFFCIFAS